ncbi:MAG TPA: PH domain-containing protein [Aggregatilineales bacterium]|nr:PH domain-containing protein [Anaerolineales bacterium]HRE49025.1 PH domain-containing protein [Aggregatilineales bacterium]
MQPPQPIYQQETLIGEWRRSMWSIGFWLRVVGTATLYYWLLWKKNQIVLTDRRVTQRMGGILGGKEISITIANITNVEIDTPPLGAIMGFADIRISSAAGGRTDQINFKTLHRPDTLKAAIYRQQDTIRRSATFPGQEGTMR